MISMVVVIIKVFIVVYVFNWKEPRCQGASLGQHSPITLVILHWPKPSPLLPLFTDLSTALQ